MGLHLVGDFLALSLDDALPLVRATTRQRQDSDDATCDDEDKNDGQNKNQCTLKHVIILPHENLNTRRCHPHTHAL